MVVHEGKVLVARRSPDAHLGGLWEFPGGRVESGEDVVAAARRELREETGLYASEIEPLVTAVYDYPDRLLKFHAFLVRDPRGEVVIERGREWAWVAPDDLERLEMPPANLQIKRALRWRLSPGSDA